MKRLCIALAALLASAGTAYAEPVNEQICKSVYKDVYSLMSYVVPCEEDIENPEILQNDGYEKLNLRLYQCDAFLSKEKVDELNQEVQEELEKTFVPKFTAQLEKDLPGYCKTRKIEIQKMLDAKYRIN